MKLQRFISIRVSDEDIEILNKIQETLGLKKRSETIRKVIQYFAKVIEVTKAMEKKEQMKGGRET